MGRAALRDGGGGCVIVVVVIVVSFWGLGSEIFDSVVGRA